MEALCLKYIKIFLRLKNIYQKITIFVTTERIRPIEMQDKRTSKISNSEKPSIIKFLTDSGGFQ